MKMKDIPKLEQLNDLKVIVSELTFNDFLPI